jgi:2Fe-2S ferredoxin
MCIPLKNELQTIVSPVSSIVIKNLSGKVIPIRRMGQSVLSALQASHVDWLHSCGGKGKCITCKFRIIHGAESLDNLTPAELYYRDQTLLSYDERLACQAMVFGDLELEVPDECKLPHISYADKPAPL